MFLYATNLTVLLKIIIIIKKRLKRFQSQILVSEEKQSMERDRPLVETNGTSLYYYEYNKFFAYLRFSRLLPGSIKIYNKQFQNYCSE